MNTDTGHIQYEAASTRLEHRFVFNFGVQWSRNSFSYATAKTSTRDWQLKYYTKILSVWHGETNPETALNNILIFHFPPHKSTSRLYYKDQLTNIVLGNKSVRQERLD